MRRIGDRIYGKALIMSIIGRFLGITKRFITDPVIRQSYLATLGFYDNTDDRKYIEN